MPPSAHSDDNLIPARNRAAREQDESALPDRNTFPHEARITRQTEFRHVFDNGEKVVGRHFVCYIVRSGGQRSTLGFAVSRKVGRAVVRNRVKRNLREFFRTHRHRFSPAVALVVVARPPSAGLDGLGCANAMRRLLQRGGILHG